MSVRFCPIASGSDGNSVYIGSDNAHILIDAGISGKRLEQGLLNGVGVSAESLECIFITHEHTDHIKSAGVLSRRYGTSLCATEKTWAYIERHDLIGKIAPDKKHTIKAGEKLEVKDITVEAFNIPHDAAEPVGYCVYIEDKKIAVATDLGCVTDNIREKLFGADIVLIESNHDIEMLKNGSYPAMLKRRILGERGHLSNRGAGELIAEIISTRMKYVFLGHLSAENNMPIVAMETVMSILDMNRIKVGKDIDLRLAERSVASKSLVL